MSRAPNPRELQEFLAAQQQLQQHQHTDNVLVEFKAGRMEYNETTHQLQADPRKGKLRLLDDDGMYRLEWYTRPANVCELNISLFPESAQWKKIENAPANSRCYVLKLHHSNTKHFFWLQEEKSDRDEEISNTINAKISSSQLNDAMDISDTTHAATSAAGAASRSQLQLDQQQFLNILQQVRQASQTSPAVSTSTAAATTSAATPSTSTTATSTAPTIASSPNTTNIPDSTQSTLLSQLKALSERFSQSNMASISTQPTLNEILDTDKVIAILNEDPTLANDLLQYLPPEQQSIDELKKQLRSPQFQSTLSRLSSILSSHHYGEAMSSLGLDPSTSNYGVLGFVEAINKSLGKTTTPFPSTNTSTTNSTNNSTSTTTSAASTTNNVTTPTTASTSDSNKATDDTTNSQDENKSS